MEEVKVTKKLAKIPEKELKEISTPYLAVVTIKSRVYTRIRQENDWNPLEHENEIKSLFKQIEDFNKLDLQYEFMATMEHFKDTLKLKEKEVVVDPFAEQFVKKNEIENNLMNLKDLYDRKFIGNNSVWDIVFNNKESIKSLSLEKTIDYIRYIFKPYEVNGEVRFPTRSEGSNLFNELKGICNTKKTPGELANLEEARKYLLASLLVLKDHYYYSNSNQFIEPIDLDNPNEVILRGRCDLEKLLRILEVEEQ